MIAASATSERVPGAVAPARGARAQVAARPRVLLLVSSLERGGAERQVVLLANHLDPQEWEVHLAVLSRSNPLARELRPHVTLHVLPKRWRGDLGVVRRVADLLRTARIDLVHAFLFDAEMAARLAARRVGGLCVIGSERNSDYRAPWHQRLALRWTRSAIAGVIANSHAGRQHALQTLLLPQERVWTVHNAVDTVRFSPGPQCEARSVLGWRERHHVIGMAANLKPQKDHALFLEVAQRVRRLRSDVTFVCAGDVLSSGPAWRRVLGGGDGMHGNTAAYARKIMEKHRLAGLNEAVRYIGPCGDMVSFYRACDLTLLTSRHEGTPNSVLESLACGVPVISTDVGDVRELMPAGCGGVVVSRRSADEIVARVQQFLADAESRVALGAAGRMHVQQKFSPAALGRHTAAVYRRVFHEQPAPQPREGASIATNLAGTP